MIFGYRWLKANDENNFIIVTVINDLIYKKNPKNDAYVSDEK